MMYAPNTVSPQHAPVAGMFAAAMLITGIFVGITFSNVFPYLIQMTEVPSPATIANFFVAKFVNIFG